MSEKNSLVIGQHKHCIFCGEVISEMPLTAECKSEYNTLTPDTSGKRYHASLGLILKPNEKLCGKDECERRQAMRIADAVAEEREECAKTCMSNVLSEEQMNGEPNFHIGEMCLRLCHERDAAAIRARGQKA